MEGAKKSFDLPEFKKIDLAKTFVNVLDSKEIVTDIINSNSQVIALGKNADLVEDNGRCHLNPHLFDGMPERALIDISIVRGTVEKIEDFQFFEGERLSMVFGIMSRSNYNTIILRRL